MMSNEFYLQDNRSYVGNDILWWAATGGYTTDLSKAEIFSREDALHQHNCRESDIPWPKEYIENKTRPAVDMQYVDIQEALKDQNIELNKPEKPKIETYNCESCGKFVSRDIFYQYVYHGDPCPRCEN